MRLRTLAVAAALLVPLAAACSSSSSSPAATATHSSASPSAMTGTETLKAVVTGSAAAANFNSSNNNAPLMFPQASLTGPVVTVIKPFVLKGSGNEAGTVTWTTPDGTIAIYHSAVANSNVQPVYTKKGDVCYFKALFGNGTFHYVPASSTGKWASVTGSGKYSINAVGASPLNAGKTTCSNNNTGNVMSSGAAITFLAVAPVTVKT